MQEGQYVRERTEKMPLEPQHEAHPEMHPRIASASTALTAFIYTRRTHPTFYREPTQMLYTIAVILVVLWLLGLVTSYTLGGFIHILLVVAIVVVLLRVINGRTRL